MKKAIYHVVALRHSTLLAQCPLHCGREGGNKEGEVMSIVISCIPTTELLCSDGFTEDIWSVIFSVMKHHPKHRLNFF